MASRNSRSNSTQLDRTLKELENAFADWENLGAGKPKAGAKDAANAESKDDLGDEKAKKKALEQSASEFQKRTQKLLDQLRQQIAELNE
jgi:hypothetical protein